VNVFAASRRINFDVFAAYGKFVPNALYKAVIFWKVVFVFVKERVHVASCVDLLVCNGRNGASRVGFWRFAVTAALITSATTRNCEYRRKT